MSETTKCARCGGDKRVYYRQLGDFDTCTDCNGTGLAPVPAAPAPEATRGVLDLSPIGTMPPDARMGNATPPGATSFELPPKRNPTRETFGHAAPEATREADALWDRVLDALKHLAGIQINMRGEVDSGAWVRTNQLMADIQQRRTEAPNARLFAFCEELGPVLWPEMNTPGHRVYGAPQTTLEEVKRLVATLAAQARENETLRAALTRIAEDGCLLAGARTNHAHEESCNACIARAALAARAPEATP